MKLENLELPAKILAAARVCQAKKDVRYYLCGVTVTPERIYGTNGHMLFVADHETDIEEPFTINIEGSIPVKAETALISDFNPEEDGTLKGLIHFKDVHDKEIVSRVFELIEHKEVDIDRVIPKSELEPVDCIGVSSDYIGRITKVQKALGFRFYGVRMNFRGPNDSIEIRFTEGSEYSESCKVIVMPCLL